MTPGQSRPATNGDYHLATLRNPRTGEYREIGGLTAWLGAFFFGPFYFMFKGVWTWGIVWLLLAIVVGVVAWPIALLACFVMAFFAGGIVRNHYAQRGFIDTAILDATRAQTEQSANVALASKTAAE